MYRKKKEKKYIEVYNEWVKTDKSMYKFCLEKSAESGEKYSTLMQQLSKGKILVQKEREEKEKRFNNFIERILASNNDFMIRKFENYFVEINNLLMLCGYSVNVLPEAVLYKKKVQNMNVNLKKLYELYYSEEFLDYCEKMIGEYLWNE